MASGSERTKALWRQTLRWMATAIVGGPLLAACQTGATHRVPQEVASLQAGKGMVIFSTSTDEVTRRLPVWLTLVDADSKNRFARPWWPMQSPAKDDFDVDHGRVFALQLKEGDYFLVPAVTKPAYCLTSFPTYKFHVGADEVVYLGNFQVWNHQTFKQSGLLEARDVAYFLEQNPQLRSKQVHTRIPVASQYDRGDCNTPDFVAGTMWGEP